MVSIYFRQLFTSGIWGPKLFKVCDLFVAAIRLKQAKVVSLILKCYENTIAPLSAPVQHTSLACQTWWNFTSLSGLYREFSIEFPSKILPTPIFQGLFCNKYSKCMFSRPLLAIKAWKFHRVRQILIKRWNFPGIIKKLLLGIKKIIKEIWQEIPNGWSKCVTKENVHVGLGKNAIRRHFIPQCQLAKVATPNNSVSGDPSYFFLQFTLFSYIKKLYYN